MIPRFVRVGSTQSNTGSLSVEIHENGMIKLHHFKTFGGSFEEFLKAGEALELSRLLALAADKSPRIAAISREAEKMLRDETAKMFEGSDK